MAKNYNKIDVIADYKTGQYTFKQLGHRHGISQAMAHKITKNISKENEELVNAIIQTNQKLMYTPKEEVNAIQKTVNAEMEKHAEFKAKLELLSDIAMAKGAELLNNTAYGADFKAILDGLDKHSVTVGYNKRFNDAASIQNINAQQNNTSETLERVIKHLPD